MNKNQNHSQRVSWHGNHPRNAFDAPQYMYNMHVHVGEGLRHMYDMTILYYLLNRATCSV